jgi:hypothetical protein
LDRKCCFSEAQGVLHIETFVMLRCAAVDKSVFIIENTFDRGVFTCLKVEG